MKKLLYLLTLSLYSLLYAPYSAFTQTIPPQFITYQKVLYDVNSANPNAPLTNQSFTTFVNINDELGNLLYCEEHYASTDANGLITVKMGDGLYTAGPITNFNQINWGVGKYYLVVDFDINGTISSTAPEQLVTVPYSFYAGNAGNGMTAVADNGNETLTFTYANGATYITPALSGITGAQGPIGLTGPSGLIGAQGVQGVAGPSGASGPAGAQGPIGLTGATGPQGIQGQAGNDGAAGPQGTIGLTGPIGVTGPAGANGTSGLNALIKTTTESAGANCVNGGTKIETGLDTNGNGILDVGEVNVSQTKYVCNGTNATSSSTQGVMVGISSSTTWTSPTGVTQIIVELWGGGGGGAYGQSGGKGGYNRSTINVIPGNSYNIVIGNGGNAATANASNPSGTGSTGSASSFGVVLSASGGIGGACCWLGGSAPSGAKINWPYSSISAPTYIPNHYFSIPGEAPGGSAGNPNGAPAPTAGSLGFAIIRY